MVVGRVSYAAAVGVATSRRPVGRPGLQHCTVVFGSGSRDLPRANSEAPRVQLFRERTARELHHKSSITGSARRSGELSLHTYDLI